MSFFRRSLLVAMTALLLTAFGLAQSNMFATDQYGTDVFRAADYDQQGTDVFRAADRDQQGTDVFRAADRDQHGTDVFRAADRDQHGTEVFRAADQDQYGNEVYRAADRGQGGIDVFQTAGRDRYGNGVFPLADPEFMREATQDAMAKINIARVALQNAKSEQVKSFAEQILSDYGQAQRGLFNIAYRQVAVLPDTLDPSQFDTFDTLLQLHGEAFDSAYMKAMLSENQTATSRFKQEATKGDEWASHTLPTLENNLKQAQKVALAVGVHSTGTSAEQPAPSAGKASNTASPEP